MAEDEHLQALLSDAVEAMYEKQRENIGRTNAAATTANSQRDSDPQRWRDLTAYWILGMCNNYGYVVMLSAAHDIIERFGSHQVSAALFCARIIEYF